MGKPNFPSKAKSSKPKGKGKGKAALIGSKPTAISKNQNDSTSNEEATDNTVMHNLIPQLHKKSGSVHPDLFKEASWLTSTMRKEDVSLDVAMVLRGDAIEMRTGNRNFEVIAEDLRKANDSLIAAKYLDKGLQMGLNIGFQRGVKEGYSRGYIKGHAEGYAVGPRQGYRKGQVVGHAQGYESGHDEGHVGGYDQGLQEGRVRGYQKAFDEWETVQNAGFTSTE